MTAMQPLHVVLVEDNPDDVRMVQLAFEAARERRFHVEPFDCLEKAVEHLQAHGGDFVLADLGLPDACGVEVVQRLHATASSVPIVVLTGRKDDAVAIAAIHAGAQDYLEKGEISSHLLIRAVDHAIERHRISQDLVQRSGELAQANDRLQLLNRQKDDFISRVSHELRTPIASIYQFTSIMTEGLAGETNAQQSQYLEIILRNTKDLRNMVGDLIEATRAEMGKLHIQPRRLAIGALIEDVRLTMQVVARTKNVVLEAESPSDLPPVLADPQRVRQILVNLIDNALKFSPDEGRVLVQASVVDSPSPCIEITVRDEGPGMSPEVCARIFQRLFQDESHSASRQGLGLGLYICEQLVEHQGGHIRAESSPECTRLCFTLPVFSLPELLAPVLAGEPKHLGSLTVLRIGAVTIHGFVPRQTRLKTTRELRSMLTKHEHAGLVVLPDMDHNSEPEHVYVVMPPTNVGELAEWIRREFETQFPPRLYKLMPEIHSRSVDVPAVGSREPATWLRDVAARIESIVEGREGEVEWCAA